MTKKQSSSIKLKNLVEKTIQETGKTEIQVRKDLKKEILKNRINKVTTQKQNARVQFQAIKEKLMADNSNATPNKLKKLIGRAEQEFYSNLKKEKKKVISNTAIFYQKKLREKWCPTYEPWWDVECQKSYDYLYLLGQLFGHNIEEGTDSFVEQCPDECAQHIDLIFKKRFSAKMTKKDVKKAAKKMKCTEGEKKVKAKLEARLKDNPENKTEEQILKEMMSSMSEKKEKGTCMSLRKRWFPMDMSWFDDDCHEYVKKFDDIAAKHGLDIETNKADLKKLKADNTVLFQKYFDLLDSKRKNCEEKPMKSMKKEKKADEKKSKVKSNEVGKKPLRSKNKKIKFEDVDA